MTSHVKYVGWTESPLYKEMPPEVGSEPDYDVKESIGIPEKETLTRELHTMTKNVPLVRQQLQLQTEHIIVSVINADGTESTRDYGSGWRLKQAIETKLMPGMSSLKINYERRVNTLFRYNLPVGLTVSYSGGTATILWRGQPLETYESGTGMTGTGLTVSRVGPPTPVGKYLYNDNPIFMPAPVLSIPIGLFMNGVLMETYICGPQHGSDFLNIGRLVFNKGPFPLTGPDDPSEEVSSGEVVRRHPYYVVSQPGLVQSSIFGRKSPAVILDMLKTREGIEELQRINALRRANTTGPYTLNEIWSPIDAEPFVPWADVVSGRYAGFVGYSFHEARGAQEDWGRNPGWPKFISGSFTTPSGKLFILESLDSHQRILPPVYWDHSASEGKLRLMFGRNTWKEWDVEDDS